MVESHSFDVDLAVKIGLNRAIILSHLAFLQKNFTKDGHDWTKTKIIRTIKKMQTVYPYLTKKEIRGALDKMEQDGILLSEIDNQNKFDRTKSYVLGSAGIEALKIDMGQFDLTKGQMPFDKKANEDLTKRQMLNDSSLNDSSNDIRLRVDENAQSDFPNPSNPFLTLKEEEKKKRGTPAPGAAKAKKTRTGREDHTWSETLAHLQDNDPAMYMWAQQTVKIWEDWMEYRIENKKCTPYGSAKTEAIAVKQLHKLAEGKESNARAIVEYVRANGYQGLYLPPELKQQPRQSGYNSAKNNQEELARTVMANRKYYPPIEI